MKKVFLTLLVTAMGLVACENKAAAPTEEAQATATEVVEGDLAYVKLRNSFGINFSNIRTINSNIKISIEKVASSFIKIVRINQFGRVTLIRSFTEFETACYTDISAAASGKKRSYFVGTHNNS